MRRSTARMAEHASDGAGAIARCLQQSPQRLIAAHLPALSLALIFSDLETEETSMDKVRGHIEDTPEFADELRDE